MLSVTIEAIKEVDGYRGQKWNRWAEFKYPDFQTVTKTTGKRFIIFSNISWKLSDIKEIESMEGHNRLCLEGT